MATQPNAGVDEQILLRPVVQFILNSGLFAARTPEVGRELEKRCHLDF